MRRVAFIVALFLTQNLLAGNDPRLKGAFREDKAGWIYLHLEGTPSEVGFQHGYLAAKEIDDALRMFAFYFKGSVQKDWNFFREAAARMFWPKLETEYQEEINGIVAGLKARGFTAYDYIDITAMNGNIELVSYYLPYLANKIKADSMNNRAPGYCSAFIATGSATADGKIVIAHNNWSEYIVGQRWNVIADIKPAKGYRILMDCMPGFIHSGDDFAINDAGLLYTETTITQFKGFDETGDPEFVRARRAAQYGSSIDDFVRIMTTRNNGAYANDWLIGDTKTNEIARLELGLKNHRVWRTKDGVYVGANYALDEKLIAEETTFDPKNPVSSPNARKKRWEQVMEQYHGKVTTDLAREFEGDHFDALQGSKASNRCVICGHNDEDPLGTVEFNWAPFFPAGSVQGKVTSTELAKEMKFWARMGHPCGEAFTVGPFLKKHPQFDWQGKFLKDMPSQPWSMFQSRDSKK